MSSMPSTRPLKVTASLTRQQRRCVDEDDIGPKAKLFEVDGSRASPPTNSPGSGGSIPAVQHLDRPICALRSIARSSAVQCHRHECIVELHRSVDDFVCSRRCFDAEECVQRRSADVEVDGDQRADRRG